MYLKINQLGGMRQYADCDEKKHSATIVETEEEKKRKRIPTKYN